MENSYVTIDFSSDGDSMVFSIKVTWFRVLIYKIVEDRVPYVGLVIKTGESIRSHSMPTPVSGRLSVSGRDLSDNI